MTKELARRTDAHEGAEQVNLLQVSSSTTYVASKEQVGSFHDLHEFTFSELRGLRSVMRRKIPRL